VSIEASSPRRRLLVTGGAGFIGANFVQHCLTVDPEASVVVLDALTYAGNLANLAGVLDKPSVKFIHGDIRDRVLVESLIRENAIDTIVHFAAESHVDRSIVSPEKFIDTNVLGTYTLLDAARVIWPDGQSATSALRPFRFHHVSTDEVFGSLSPDASPVAEASAYGPNSPYAASKAGADHLVRAYHRTYGLPVTISHCSNNYGPYQFPEKLLPLMLVNALEGKPLPLYGDGANVRDWLHVSDHCRGIMLVLERGEVGAAYNICAGNQWRNSDLVRLLCELLDELFLAQPCLRERFPSCPAARGVSTSELITFVEDRPGHDRRYALNGRKIARELGFKPVETLQSGLRNTISWYLEEEQWWRDVMDGSYQEWERECYSAV